MRVLDLFSGLGGGSQAFLDRGHEVVRIDNDPAFADVPNTIIADVLEWEPEQDYDVVWASCPCQAFSLASVRHHMDASIVCSACGHRVERLRGEEWQACCNRPRYDKDTLTIIPASDFAKLSVRLVERTIDLLDVIKPRWFWMENPRGTMKHFIPAEFSDVTVWYCRYGDLAAKPTKLYGHWPDTWKPRPECHNGNPDHAAARRGAKTGTQGKKGAAARALVPYRLSEEVCLACEEALG